MRVVEDGEEMGEGKKVGIAGEIMSVQKAPMRRLARASPARVSRAIPSRSPPAAFRNTGANLSQTSFRATAEKPKRIIHRIARRIKYIHSTSIATSPRPRSGSARSAHRRQTLRGTTAYPNVSPGASSRNGVPFQSAVFLKTVFPHHLLMEFSPIRPC